MSHCDIIVVVIPELFTNVVRTVVAKDSDVVTITKSSPVFVNRGLGASCMVDTWGVLLMLTMGTRGCHKTHLLDYMRFWDHN